MFTRKLKNISFTAFAIISFIIIIIPLLHLIFTILFNGIQAINIDFFTKLPPPPGYPDGGVLNAIEGTILLVGLAMLISFPVGFFGGIYLAEYGKGRLSEAIRILVNALSGIPSIVAGVFAYTLIVIKYGFSAIAGALALSLLSIPYIVRTTEEALKAVPREVKEGGLALGIPKWKVIMYINVGVAKPRIVAGALLAMARITGEAAPLLFTAFGSRYLTTSLFEPADALPLLIYRFAFSPYSEWHRLAWGAALILILVVLSINLSVKLYMSGGFKIRINKKILGAILIVILASSTAWAMYPRAQVIKLKGAGATFPYPLISLWAKEFHEEYSNITVEYQAIGSGGGIRAILDQTVDFAGSDAPLNPNEYANASKIGTIMHIPETLGGVVMAYNLPGLNGRLRLTGEIIADIYLGNISKWNDPRIQAINPDLNLPDRDIIVVKRSDGSGTTYIFTDYLSNVSKAWREYVGKTKIFSFPDKVGNRGLSAPGNPGVAQMIIQNPYSLGYIELAYAHQQNMTTALIRNKDGYFAEGNLTTISAAAAGAAKSLPLPWESWSEVTIVNAPGKLAYPISSFTYILVYREQCDYKKYLALKTWLEWILTKGQDYAPELLYPKLPQEVVELGLLAVKSLIYTSGSLSTGSFHSYEINNPNNALRSSTINYIASLESLNKFFKKLFYRFNE